MVLAAVVTAAAVAALRPVAPHLGLLSEPGPLNPEPHPVPLVGGAALLFGAVFTVAFDQPALFLVLVSAWLLGTLDDRFGVPALIRLGAWAVLGGVAGAILEGSDPRWVIALGVLWGVLAGVGVNLLDGRDGLATTVVGVSLVGLALLARDVGPARLVPVLAGFLVWNLPPARAYLGNAGASVLGMALAAGAVEAGRASGVIPVALAIGLVVAEVAATTVRRARSRRGMDRRERGHGYDRLVARGWPVGAVMVTFAGVQAVMVGAALVVARSSATSAAVVGVASLAMLTTLVLASGSLQPD